MHRILFGFTSILIFQLAFAQANFISCNNWSTFFGGATQDEIKGICSDAGGNIFVAGSTNSNDFPVTPGIIQDTITGDYDAFVSKFDSCGNLIWSTLVGSTDFDAAEKIICLSNGDLVVCGSTFGTNFPVTTNAYQSSNGGAYDAFIARINTNGNLMWCSYFGNGGADFAYDITTDKNENIYIGGSTSSSNLPTTAQSYQQTAGGALDAFITSFTSSGNFRWCTYFGGSSSEDVHVLRNDKHGNIYIAGGTFSQNIVMSNGAYQQFSNGGMEIYVLKVDSTGAGLWSTYLGGTGLDDCYALVTDSAANVYLSGPTYSTQFPVTPGCYQDSLNLYADIYLTKFSENGTLMWSTYLGGSDLDDSKSLCVNAAQEVALLGRTQSVDIPLAGTPFQSVLNGNYDLYVARFDSAGIFLFGSYFGGSNEEIPFAISSSGLTYCYVAGGSYSSDYPIVPGSYQPVIDSLQDGIVSKLLLPTNSTLAVAPHIEKSSVLLYPNPAQNEIHFSCEEKIETILIRNTEGKTVIQQKNEKQFFPSLEIKNLPAGIYIAEIRTISSIHQKKLIKTD